ncbi:MAG TPA: ABC transporter permease subunit [Trebonia sp.]|jgi:ABC-type transport system involved in multi-copper enzyme maturation permease subunit|nr:ABC transporter permease subunit [Trebonia sp.]
MTAATMAPPRPGPAAGRDSFAYVLHAEWTKFRTVRGWVIAVVVGALVTLLIGVYTGARSQDGCATGPCHFTIPTGPGGEAVTDTYYFVHRPLAGDGSITVRVTSLATVLDGGLTPQGPTSTQPAAVPWSKAGLLIGAGPGQGAAYAAVMVTGGHGTRMQWNYTGDSPGLAGGVSAAAPRWLRLTRDGDVLTGYDSADGRHWTRLGTVTVPGLAATVQAGLFATSPGYTATSSQQLSGSSGSGAPTDATATFDRVSLRGGWPGTGPGTASAGAAWAGTSVNGGRDSISYPSGTVAGYHQAGGAFTVTGSGDIAPGVDGASSIDATLAGLFIGLVAVIVVGALFMAAEYRRGLIRVTLAASPRRGRVLAAKAVVLGAVTFAAGLTGSAGAILIGTPLLRANGNPIYPASALTDARVIVGTAALVAVFAVFALGVGAILRHGAATVTVVITAVVLPYLLAAAFPVLPDGAADWLLRITPAAGFAIKQVIPAYPQVAGSFSSYQGYFPLAPWAGFAVTCGYAALALALGAWSLRRRDA